MARKKKLNKKLIKSLYTNLNTHRRVFKKLKYNEKWIAFLLIHILNYIPKYKMIENTKIVNKINTKKERSNKITIERSNELIKQRSNKINFINCSINSNKFKKCAQNYFCYKKDFGYEKCMSDEGQLSQTDKINEDEYINSDFHIIKECSINTTENSKNSETEISKNSEINKENSSNHFNKSNITNKKNIDLQIQSISDLENSERDKTNMPINLFDLDENKLKGLPFEIKIIDKKVKPKMYTYDLDTNERIEVEIEEYEHSTEMINNECLKEVCNLHSNNSNKKIMNNKNKMEESSERETVNLPAEPFCKYEENERNKKKMKRVTILNTENLMNTENLNNLRKIVKSSFKVSDKITELGKILEKRFSKSKKNTATLQNSLSNKKERLRTIFKELKEAEKNNFGFEKQTCLLQTIKTLNTKLKKMDDDLMYFYRETELLKKENIESERKFQYEKLSRKEVEKERKLKENEIIFLSELTEELKEDLKILKKENKLVMQENEKLKEKDNILEAKKEEEISLKNSEIKKLKFQLKEFEIENLCLIRENESLKRKLKMNLKLLNQNYKLSQVVYENVNVLFFCIKKLSFQIEVFEKEFQKECEKNKKLEVLNKIEGNVNILENKIKEVDRKSEKYKNILRESLKKHEESIKKVKEGRQDIKKYECQLVESHEIIIMQKKLINDLKKELEKHNNFK